MNEAQIADLVARLERIEATLKEFQLLIEQYKPRFQSKKRATLPWSGPR